MILVCAVRLHSKGHSYSYGSTLRTMQTLTGTGPTPFSDAGDGDPDELRKRANSGQPEERVPSEASKRVNE